MFESRNWITVQSGGLTLFGVLHLPLTAKRAPVVIIVHGFASSKHGTNRSYVTFAEKLAALGIATLRFDLRGSGDSEGDLSSVTISHLLEDTLAIYNFAKEHEGLDCERLGLFGSSLGGTIAILAAQKIRTIAALTVWSPIASGELWVQDFISQHPQYAKADPREVLSTYQGISLHPDFCTQFAKASAATAMTELPHVPFLHLQGEEDKTVSLVHQRAYKNACKGRSAPAQFITYPNVDHKFAKSKAFPEVTSTVVGWFKEHL